MKDKNNTRAKIIEAMYKLVASEGYEKASIGKISEDVGITKAAAYYYFKSKEDIFLELVKTFYEDDYADFVDNISKATTKDEYKKLLLECGCCFIEHYEKDKDYRKVCYEVDIQIHRIKSVKEYVDKANDEGIVALIGILKHGSKLGLFPEDTVNEKAEYLHVVMEGLDKVILLSHKVSPKKVWQLAVEQLLLQEKK